MTSPLLSLPPCLSNIPLFCVFAPFKAVCNLTFVAGFIITRKRGESFINFASNEFLHPLIPINDQFSSSFLSNQLLHKKRLVCMTKMIDMMDDIQFSLH